MTFSAINTYEQEIKQRNERHTLELQLEQAMQVYQSALDAQRLDNYERAYEHYQTLFAFDVLKPKKLLEKQGSPLESEANAQLSSTGAPESSGISTRSLQLGPAIRLRAMALKNFALLLLKGEDITIETVDKALEYLGEALDLVGTDDKEKLIIPSLVQIAWSVGLDRLARLGLEILVENNEGSALVPLEEWIKNQKVTKTLFGPRTIEKLVALEYIKGREDECKDKKLEVPEFLQKYDYLSLLKSQQPPLASILDDESKVEVSLSTKSWECLISSLNDVVSSAGKRNKRKYIKDSYAWSQKDIWCVEFVGTSPQQDNSVLPSISLENDEKDITNDMSRNDGGTASAEGALDNTNETAPSTPAAEMDPVTSSPINSPKGAEALNHTPPPLAAGQQSPLEVIHEPKLVASPVKRRRIDRVKRSTLALPADFGLVDSNFAFQFNGYIALIGEHQIPQFHSPANLFLDPTQDIPPELVEAAKLRDLLSGWDSRESGQFLTEATSMKPQKGGIMTTLRKENLGEFHSGDSEDEDEEVGTEEILQESIAVDRFLSANNNSHIQQIRWSLACVLLDNLSVGNKKPAFAQMVFKFIDEIESLLWSRRRYLSADETVTIFALYADHWIKEKSAELKIKLCRWEGISAINSTLPHAWIAAFVNQEDQDATPESSAIQFEVILSFIENHRDEINAAHLEAMFSYLNEVPPLNMANIQMQISKFKAAAAFERVVRPPEETSNSSDENTEEDNIKLLEAMLMPESHERPESTPESEFGAIQDFLGYSQPQFKMGLWYILLAKYESSGNLLDSFVGLTQIFSEAMNSLDRGEPLLQVMSIAHDVGKRLVALLERNPDILQTRYPSEGPVEILSQIMNLLQTLQLFLLYDDAVNSNLLQKPITPSWPRALQKFRELVVMWWCIFYLFWLRCIPDSVSANQETINDILSIIHERLGNLGYCGVANSCLLNLHFREIVRLNWDGSALDMSQCLKCKFGLNLSLYGDVANHHTVATDLTHEEAVLLLPYVMRMILDHRNFQQVVMRMDTRSVIDEFANAYGSNDKDGQNANQNYVESYLSQDFSPHLLKRAWYGHDDTKVTYASRDDGQAIWLVQAGILMNQYRMRRRQAYAASSVRTDSLELAIDLYMDDISARPTRLESWFGLAQAYLYMCEDCLTFGDELPVENMPEIYCRKALLASSRAISLQVSEGRPGCQNHMSVAQKELFETAKTNIWSLFGYSLLLAIMPPMERRPFNTDTRPLQPLLVELPNNQSLRLGIKRPSEVSDALALRISLRCLAKMSDAQQKWVTYMHQTMIAFKLDLEASEVLGYVKKANEASPHGVYDSEIESIHVGWHYFREKKLSEGDLRELLKELSCGGDDDNATAQQIIESKLRWLAHKDKWLHKPRYLLAKIHELDHNNTRAAQEELMHLFTLKSPTKPLVIWKTESDLPGQHGVYMTLYVRYMTDLMYTNKDSAGLLLMARRFRRAGIEMWNHNVTYEYIFSQTCALVHQLIPCDTSQKSKYSDVLMADVPDSETFDTVVKMMTASLENNFSEQDKWTQALSYVIELRRLHSGPSTIAQADELVIVIFLTIYKDFSASNKESISARLQPQTSEPNKESNPSVPAAATNGNKAAADGDASTPAAPSRKTEKAPSRKKIIRKDVIHSAQQYLKPIQQILAKNDDWRMPEELKTLN